MEILKYSILVENNDFEELANIFFTADLVTYQYKGKYLIEYLLERNIHSKNMDNEAVFKEEFFKYYLKYNITTPLLNTHLVTLLKSYNGKTLLEHLLSKLSNPDKLKLYHNIKKNSYWEYHNNEKEIVESFARYGIELPKIFVNVNKLENKIIILNKENRELLDELRELFSDHDEKIVNIIISEFSYGLKIDEEKTRLDLIKLIEYKTENPNFRVRLSNNSEGIFYDRDNLLVTSQYRRGVLLHEFSHLLFHANEKTNKDSRDLQKLYSIIYGIDEDNRDACIGEYEEIRKTIDDIETRKVINDYLNKFHEKYHLKEKEFEQKYYREINKKYHDYNSYVRKVCEDILENKPYLVNIAGEETFGIRIDYDNIERSVSEILFIEKKEFIIRETKNYYSEELMLENLLDALIYGRSRSSEDDAEILSGHSTLEFEEKNDLSFNECLANYYAITRSEKKDELLVILREIVGDELITFLDNYINNTRNNKHQI